MKKLFWAVMAFLSLALVACQDDEGKKHNDIISPIAGDDFVDPRDGKVYRTIRVGNQLWFAQNLAYAPPGYSMDGAFTWGERPIDTKNIKPTQTDVLEMMKELVEDSAFSWKIKLGVVELPFAPMLNGWITNMNRGRLTYDGLRAQVKQFMPAFDDELEQRILKFAERPSTKLKLGKVHFETAEEANNGYVAKNGFLYTYAAAKACVPEGWRLPTDEDWLKLEQSLGMSKGESQALNAWRGEKVATRFMDENGFAAQMAGGQIYGRENADLYANKGNSFYYWSSTTQQLNDSVNVALIRMGSNLIGNKVWRGTSMIKGLYKPVLYSVRCVKDL